MSAKRLVRFSEEEIATLAAGARNDRGRRHPGGRIFEFVDGRVPMTTLVLKLA